MREETLCDSNVVSAFSRSGLEQLLSSCQVSSSIAARNSLYGLEVQKNQPPWLVYRTRPYWDIAIDSRYLNIDFVDDVDAQASPPDVRSSENRGHHSNLAHAPVHQ